MNTYPLNDTVTLSTIFTVGGVATDPTTVALIINAPDGTQQTYTYAAAAVTRTATGAYTKNISPNQTGVYGGEWVGTGPAAGVEPFQFRVSDILAAAPRSYVSMPQFKESLSLSDQSYADADILIALAAASRGLEDAYETYWIAPTADTRYYTRSTSRIVHLGDVQSISSVNLDYSLSDVYGQLWDWDTGLGTYSTLLDPSWYRLLPIQNGPSGNGEPYQQLQLNRASQRYILPSGQDAIRITGTFGWTQTPAGVKAAVTIIASRLLERTRSAPFGIIALGADGVALRARDIAQDPDIRFAMGPAAGTTSLFA